MKKKDLAEIVEDLSRDWRMGRLTEGEFYKEMAILLLRYVLDNGKD